MGEGSGSGGRGEAAFPVEEKGSEHGDVVYAGAQHEVVDFFGAEDVAERGRARLRTGGVLFPHAGVARVDAEEFAGLCVFDNHGACVGEIFFDGVEGLHGDDIVFAGCGREVFVEGGGLEIREQHHDGPVSLKTESGAKRLGYVGVVGCGLEEEDFADEAEGVASTASGWDEEFVTVGEEEEADLVIVLDGAEGEDCREFSGKFAFGAGGAENAGGADVDEQQEGEFTFFRELFDIGFASDFSDARGDIPLDEANFVAGLVFANFFKVHAPAFEHATVLARERGGHGVPCSQLNPADALEDFLSLRSIGCCGWHGVKVGARWGAFGFREARLGYRELSENAGHDVLRGDFFGVRFEAGDDAVAEHVGGDAFDIVRGDEAASVQVGVGAGGEGEGDGGARRGSVAEEGNNVGEAVGSGFAGGEDDVDDVVFHASVDEDGVDEFTGADDVGRFEDALDVEVRGGGAHEVEDLSFLLAGGVPDLEFEHESVELGFGEGVGAFLFEGVLGGENDEGVREFVGGVADGDLAFGHGFEEGALNLCGGAVDFVGEDEVGEEGPLFGGELAGARVVDEGSDEISWEKIRGELDALELGVDTGREGFDREGFCDAWDTFEEDVSVGEEPDEEAVDEGLLSDDDA